MTKILYSALMVLLVLAGFYASAGRGDDVDKPSKTAELMRKKLKCSQGVLEGIALNQFDKIADNADELITISQKAEWVVVKTPQYELFSNQFRRSAESLVKNAKAKNLDGAALDYVDLTMTCVKCHKYVRETRGARRDGDRGVDLADFRPERDGTRIRP
jgi:cytochrome c556